MRATICRIVIYVLSPADAAAINRRRTDGSSIARRLSTHVDAATPIDHKEGLLPPIILGWPAGAQAHIGNVVEAGMEFPAMVVRDWIKEGEASGSKLDPNPWINLQVFLDGNDVFWAVSARQAVGDNPSLEYGSWHWPVRE